MLLFEYDTNKKAMINPTDFQEKIEGMPKTIITFFETKILDEFLKTFKHEIIGETGSACKRHPVYKVNYKGKEFAVMQAAVGAPYCVSIFEEVIAMGVKNILMFGSCGTLIDLEHTSIIIPTHALREEGTSYHYLPASDEIQLQPKYVDRLIEFCAKNKVHYAVGKTWTTDAIFRETRKKVKDRVKQGCVSVEMECASMAALCKFRNVNFSEFFYVTDSLAEEEYDIGILRNKKKLNGEDKILTMAFDMALDLFK